MKHPQTPEIRPEEVRIHLVFPSRMDVPGARECLTDGEKARASRFHFQKDADHWICCRAALRTILGGIVGIPPKDVSIDLSPAGKPILAPPFTGLHFNLSHCEDLAVIAFSWIGPLGIDVEPKRRAGSLLGCEPTFCHPLEIESLPSENSSRAEKLLEIWTAKEALLKAVGTGLLHPPETIRIRKLNSGFHGIPDEPFSELATLRIHELHHPDLDDHQSFLAISQAGSENIVFSEQNR